MTPEDVEKLREVIGRVVEFDVYQKTRELNERLSDLEEEVRGLIMHLEEKGVIPMSATEAEE